MEEMEIIVRGHRIRRSTMRPCQILEIARFLPWYNFHKMLVSPKFDKFPKLWYDRQKTQIFARKPAARQLQTSCKMLQQLQNYKAAAYHKRKRKRKKAAKLQLSQKKMICFACEPAAGQLRNDNFWKKWKFLVMRNSYNFCGRTVHFWYMKNCKFLIQMTSVFYICTTLKKGFFNSRTFLLLPYNKKIPPHKSSTAYT